MRITMQICSRLLLLAFAAATLSIFISVVAPVAAIGAPTWPGYAQNDRHTADSPTASQSLQRIHWHTPVDLAPQYSGSELLIHYGSPIVTALNTVVVPVKTGATNGFRIEAHNGSDGSLKWQQSSDYVLPPHDWTPSFGPTMSPGTVLYWPGAGGTLFIRGHLDDVGAASPGRYVFYGKAAYNANPAAYKSTVFINTPLTSDRHGNIYFGFMVTGTNPSGLVGGIARVTPSGVGTWISAASAAADSSMTKVVHNCAPALSPDDSTLYVTVNNGNGSGGASGYLAALDSTTLQPLHRRLLLDPGTGNPADLNDDGTSSPTIGSDGDVYIGVLENPFGYNHDRGWLLHFSADLSALKVPGAFGWDDTASIVQKSLVPLYSTKSPYLLLCKYNNYVELGGDGVNRVAIVDPDQMEDDPVTGACVMKVVESVVGPTPDTQYLSSYPNAVREWCINSAAIDLATHSAIVNNEDGACYRWDFLSNTLTEKVVLTSGIGEAYTPTVIGPDGTSYAINNATLYALGN